QRADTPSSRRDPVVVTPAGRGLGEKERSRRADGQDAGSAGRVDAERRQTRVECVGGSDVLVPPADDRPSGDSAYVVLASLLGEHSSARRWSLPNLRLQVLRLAVELPEDPRPPKTEVEEVLVPGRTGDRDLKRDVPERELMQSQAAHALTGQLGAPVG